MVTSGDKRRSIMAETKTKLTAIDPVWSRVRDEAYDMVKTEPLLGGLVHSSLLHHASLERALAYRFSLKLASGEMSEQILREIADEAYASDLTLGQSARVDIMAVFDRDPACHRVIQPILFFKGFQAIQAYRIFGRRAERIWPISCKCACPKCLALIFTPQPALAAAS
jgi:serine O-acetyltransferase